LGAFKGGVAARYSVPPSAVAFLSADDMTPLDDATALEALTGDFIARITEAGGRQSSWVFRFERK
jgi:hypothetical protein